MIVFLALLALISPVATTLSELGANSTLNDIHLAPINFGQNNLVWSFSNATMVTGASQNTSGNIVLLEKREEPQESILLDFQRRGAVAVFIRASDPGRGEYIRNTMTGDILIPVAEIETSDLSFEYVESKGFIIVSSSPDDNPWVKHFESPGMIVWQITIIAMNLGAFAYVAVKICMYVLDARTSCTISVPFLSLILEAFAVGSRLIIHGIDPVGYLKVYPFGVIDMSFPVSLSFTLASSMLQALFWHQTLVKKDFKVRRYLTTLQYVFYVYIGILFVAVFLQAAGNWLFSSAVGLIGSALIVITLLGSFVYCIVIAGIIASKLKHGVDDVHARRLSKKVFRRTIFLATGLFLVLLFIVLFAVDLTNDPVPYILIWYSFFTLTTWLDIAQIYMIKAIPGGAKSSTGDGSTTNSSQGTTPSGSVLKTGSTHNTTNVVVI